MLKFKNLRSLCSMKCNKLIFSKIFMVVDTSIWSEENESVLNILWRVHSTLSEESVLGRNRIMSRVINSQDIMISIKIMISSLHSSGR